MKVWLVAILLAAQVTFNPNEPPPYPEGSYCTPKGDKVNGLQTPDHPCSCQNTVMPDPRDGECDMPLHMDAKCLQYCTRAHCQCPDVCVKDATPPADDPQP